MYVAQTLFIGRADDEDAFRELVLSALDGDTEAREQLRASALHIIAVDQPLDEKAA